MYRCCKLVTYVGVNQVDFQSKTAKLTPNYLKPKSQQEKAVFCQKSCKIQATGRIFSLEIKFCCFANGNFAKFKFRLLLHLNLSLIAYMLDIQKSKFANIYFREFDQSEPGC